jgi:CrcB protein
MNEHDGGVEAGAGLRDTTTERGTRRDRLPIDPDVTPADRVVPGPDARPPAPTPPASPATHPRVQPRVQPRGRARARYLRGRIRRVFHLRWDILAVIAAGGALGSLARWQLSQQLPHPVDAFPWATFEANITGCLLLGVLMVFVIDVWPPSRYLRPFLGVGVLGGFTTFSTYMLDTRGLLVAGHTTTAGAYLFGSLTAGLAAVWAGVTLARLTVRTAERRRLRRLRHEAHQRREHRRTSLITPTSRTRSTP